MGWIKQNKTKSDGLRGLGENTVLLPTPTPRMWLCQCTGAGSTWAAALQLSDLGGNSTRYSLERATPPLRSCLTGPSSISQYVLLWLCPLLIVLLPDIIYKTLDSQILQEYPGRPSLLLCTQSCTLSKLQCPDHVRPPAIQRQYNDWKCSTKKDKQSQRHVTAGKVIAFYLEKPISPTPGSCFTLRLPPVLIFLIAF